MKRTNEKYNLLLLCPGKLEKTFLIVFGQFVFVSFSHYVRSHLHYNTFNQNNVVNEYMGNVLYTEPSAVYSRQ